MIEKEAWLDKLKTCWKSKIEREADYILNIKVWRGDKLVIGLGNDLNLFAEIVKKFEEKLDGSGVHNNAHELLLGECSFAHARLLVMAKNLESYAQEEIVVGRAHSEFLNREYLHYMAKALTIAFVLLFTYKLGGCLDIQLPAMRIPL